LDAALGPRGKTINKVGKPISFPILREIYGQNYIAAWHFPPDSPTHFRGFVSFRGRGGHPVAGPEPGLVRGSAGRSPPLRRAGRLRHRHGVWPSTVSANKGPAGAPPHGGGFEHHLGNVQNLLAA